MFTAMLATLTKTDDENTAASNSVFIFETWLQQLRRASSIFLVWAKCRSPLRHGALHDC